MAANEYPGAEPFVPPGEHSLKSLAEAARDCQGCDLFERASQTVFGTGSPHARIMLVGEQPGDAEDKEGKPFVGPAGRVLARALGAAGISEDDSYITNAVKHFRWRDAPAGGKGRIHQRPDTWHIRACGPWLSAEIERVNPRVIVALGAVAGQAMFGSSFRVGAHRGRAQPWRLDGDRDNGRSPSGRGRIVVATIHPSAVLRATDRDSAYRGLVDDLAIASDVLGVSAGRS
ncbi:MAG TPA: UdgX family uracil-DNA binding protein [Streptosporangiaceae bacterium]|nr:UdgX family uracil-DNA binding protein [Streptosporangiaceae bacterium]